MLGMGGDGVKITFSELGLRVIGMKSKTSIHLNCRPWIIGLGHGVEIDGDDSQNYILSEYDHVTYQVGRHEEQNKWSLKVLHWIGWDIVREWRLGWGMGMGQIPTVSELGNVIY